MAERELRARIPGVRIDFDGVLGTPQWVASTRAFLTGPDAKGLSASALAGSPAADPDRTAKAFLAEHLALFGHGPELLDAARVKRQFVTSHNGLRTVVWEQHFEGIPVFEGLVIAHTTRRGELVSLSSRFVPDVMAAADAGTPKWRTVRQSPAIAAEAAAALAAQDLGETLAAREVKAGPLEPGDPALSRRFRAAPLNGEGHLKLVWLPLHASAMRLCWEVILTSRARGEMYRVLIDAQTGEALVRHCLTAYLSEATYRVYTGDSPSPMSPGCSSPTNTQPPIVPRALLTLAALDTNASPAGWISEGVNETRGNNADAHCDRDGNDIPETRPQGAPFRVFDFPLDLTQAPATYAGASVVQLFYWINWMHDRLYGLGFTEAAGNFQIENFSRGGLGGDAVQADAQDGSGSNNANFATPPDGFPGRMQVFVWDYPAPNRDGALDAELILHEYTHGLSNRRVGGGIGLNALQSGGLGEGWSDFYALALLSEPGDDVDGVYAMGAYASYGLGHLTKNYYFGLRRYPYCTDLDKNPLTFKDIDPFQYDPHPGVPKSPNAPRRPGDAAEVHAQGEVWCAVLWEVRANLIRKYGWTNGNHLALQLVSDGMNLTPPDPSFVQARDAVLQADLVNNGGANLRELWAGFAKRGLGAGASAPSADTTAGIHESFDVADALQTTPAGGFIVRGPAGGPFYPNPLIFTLTNAGSQALNWTAQSTVPWLVLSPDHGTLAPGGAAVTVSASLAVAANALPPGTYPVTVWFTNLDSQIGLGRTCPLLVGQKDYFTQFFPGSVTGLSFRSLTFTPDGSPSFYSVCSEAATRFPADPTGGTELILTNGSFALVTLPAGTNVSIYGTSTNAFFVMDCGTITLTRPDVPFLWAMTNQFLLPRVSGLYGQFISAGHGGGGTLSWQMLSNRVAVTFLNAKSYVPGLDVQPTNNFQIELFFDGRIRMTWLDINAWSAVVGLSAGTSPLPDFFESDFSSYAVCALPLAITVPSSVIGGSGLLPGQGRVNLFAPASSDVTVTLASSDPAQVVVPSTVVIPAGQTDAVFDLTIPDDGRLNGAQVVTVSAQAPGYAAASGDITVLDHQTATLHLSLPATAAEGQATVQGVVEVSAPPAADVLVSLASSDAAAIQVPASVLLPAGQTSAAFIGTISDDAVIEGPQMVTITAHVPNWTDGAAQITILDNEGLILGLSLPASTWENAGVLTGAGMVCLPGTLPTNLVVSLTSDAPGVVTVPATVIVPAGKTRAAFDLTMVDNLVQAANPTVTITASATGFGAGSGTLIVLDDESPLPPANPRPADLADNVPFSTSLEWSNGPGGELLVNGGFEAGTLAGWRQVASTGGYFVISDGTHTPYSPDGAFSPLSGKFSAVAESPSGTNFFLYQDIALPTGAPSLILRWAHRVRNFHQEFSAKQQFRVELRDTNDMVLAVPFTTQPGDPLLGDWVRNSYDLARFGGQTVRVAFCVNPGKYFLNVYLDEVSIEAGGFSETITNDIYFGTSPVLGPDQFLGSTTNHSWPLPLLSAQTRYFWRVVARNGGAATSPVWQFTTMGVDHFVWEPLDSPLQINQPFRATLTAKDALGRTVTNFAGPVSLRAGEMLHADFESGLQGFNLHNLTGSGNGLWHRSSGRAADSGHSSSASLYYGRKEGPNGGGDYDLGYANGGAVVSPQVMLPAGLGPYWLSFNYLMAVESRQDRDQAYIEVSTNNGAFFEPVANKNTIGGLTNTTGGKWMRDVIDLSAYVGSTIRLRFRFDTFNTANNWAEGWYLDDVVVGTGDPAKPVTLTPDLTGTFTNGFWSGDIMALDPAFDTALIADDGNGHTGLSRPLDLAAPNDLVLRLGASPGAVSFGTRVTYTLTLTNTGPTPATGVMLTNILPVNALFVSASASQGSCWQAGGSVTCDLGTLPCGTNASIVIEVLPAVAGVSLTNTAGVWCAEPEAYLKNNTAVVVTTVALPAVDIKDAAVLEGNIGMTNLVFPLTLSAPSLLPVSVTFGTADGGALAGADYLGTNNCIVTFPPGTTNRSFTVAILGDVLQETNETFFVNLSNPTNAVLACSQGTGTILNDDGLPGDIYTLEWTPIASPQFVGQPFSVSLIARDSANAIATHFNGLVTLRPTVNPALATNTIIGNRNYNNEFPEGSETVGYSFTPNTNLTVTHLRHFFGNKVSLWTDAGALLLSQNVASEPGTWVETPLETPLQLSAGTRYRLAAYSGGGMHHMSIAAPALFAHGTIDQSYATAGDNFPNRSDGARWWLVDLRYVPGPAAMPPFDPVVADFTKGLWSGTLVVPQYTADLVLSARDGEGRVGLANPISVIAQPRLQTSAASNGLFLSWPADMPGFLVETRPSLLPGSWERLTNAPAIVGGQFTLQVAPSNATRFYRLRFSGP